MSCDIRIYLERQEHYRAIKVVILSSLHCCIQKLRDGRMGKVRKHKQKAPRVDPVGLDSAIAELQHGMDQVGKFFLKMML